MTAASVVVGAAGVLATKGSSEERMTHIALLGDSVIDNKAYVGAGPDVAEQVRMLAPKEWRVARLAVDGALDRLVTTHLIDEHAPVLFRRSKSRLRELAAELALGGETGLDVVNLPIDRPPMSWFPG